MNEVLNKNQYDENGQKHGYWEIYFSNSNLAYKVSYINGLRDGNWERYWLNGNLWSKGNYINGQRHGYWEWFNVDGEKVIEYYFL